MTFQQLLDCADGGENCILCFPNNEIARKFVDFVQTKRNANYYEMEAYSSKFFQFRYSLGKCRGSTCIGYEDRYYTSRYTFYYYTATAKVV